jgi:hypothetical protein
VRTLEASDCGTYPKNEVRSMKKMLNLLADVAFVVLVITVIQII